MKGDKTSGRKRIRLRTTTVASSPKTRGKADKSAGSKLGRLGSLAAVAAGGAAMLKKMRSKSANEKTVDLTAVPPPPTPVPPTVEPAPPVVVDQTIDTSNPRA